MSELYKLGIEEAARGLAKGEFSSVELTQAVIDRVKAENPRIGAYLTFDEEGALCGYKAWKDEIEPVALMLHSMLEIIEFYTNKLKNQE